MSRTRPGGFLSSPMLAVGAALALIGLVAATSHESLLDPPRDGVGYVSELLTVVGSSFAATFAAAAVLVLLGRKRRDIRLSSAFPAAVVVAVLVSLLGISRTDLHLEAPPSATEQADDSDAGPLGIRLKNNWQGPAFRRYDEEPVPDGVLPPSPARALLVRGLLVLLAASALALVARMWKSGRRGWAPDLGTRAPPGLDTRGHEGRAAAHAAVVRSIDAMLANADDRTAIIGAYARLLEDLETIGAGRRPYEGPTEHLHRVLGELDVAPGPLRTLVRLFQIARFSQHSLTAVHRQEALAALRSVADSLAPPEPAHPAARAGE